MSGFLEVQSSGGFAELFLLTRALEWAECCTSISVLCLLAPLARMLSSVSRKLFPQLCFSAAHACVLRVGSFSAARAFWSVVWSDSFACPFAFLSFLGLPCLMVNLVSLEYGLPMYMLSHAMVACVPPWRDVHRYC